MHRSREDAESSLLLKRTRRWASFACALAATAALVGGLAGCWRAPAGVIVARVGERAISKAAVDHWTSVIARKGSFDGVRGEPRGTARERALAFLISSDWLIGEAAAQGSPVSERAVNEELAGDHYESAELQRTLRQSTQTIADVKLEVSAELALDAIRQRLAERTLQTPPREREVVDFYRRHRSLFHTPAARVTDLLEEQPSASAAAALGRRLGAGSRFAKAAFRERITRTAMFLSTPEKRRALSVIFATRPGVVGRPVLINDSWVVFVVRTVTPPRPESLAEAHADVLRDVENLRRRETAAKFDRGYRARWLAKTRCRTGFVVQGCPQSARPLGRFEDPFSNEAGPRGGT
jgi:hypothetical protein